MAPKRDTSTRPSSGRAVVPPRNRDRKGVARRAPEAHDEHPTPKAKVTRVPKFAFLAPVQATKRVPKRNNALGDYVVASPGLPSRGSGGLHLTDSDEYDAAVGGYAPTADDPASPPLVASPQAGAWNVAARAAAAWTGSGAAPGVPSSNGSRWLDFSGAVESCVTDGLLSPSLGAEMRRLAYMAGGDVVSEVWEPPLFAVMEPQARVVTMQRAHKLLAEHIAGSKGTPPPAAGGAAAGQGEVPGAAGAAGAAER